MRSGKGRLGQTDGGDHSALGAAYAAAGDGDDSRKE
jgi:Flp pilus assembly protein TadD